MLFDKICRKNGILHRLIAPASPNQNGKVERFHGTLRPEFLDIAGPSESVEHAQATVDAWVHQYNHDRPHQGLNEAAPVTRRSVSLRPGRQSEICCRSGCPRPWPRPPQR